MNKVIIELYVPEEVNDISVGKALGIAIMTNELRYSYPLGRNDEKDVDDLINAMMVYNKE